MNRASAVVWEDTKPEENDYFLWILDKTEDMKLKSW